MKKQAKRDIAVLSGFLAIIVIAGAVVLGNSIVKSFREASAPQRNDETVQGQVSDSEVLNGVESRELVASAREYIKEKPRVFFNNQKWVKWKDGEALGTQLDAGMFLNNQPDSIEYIPLGQFERPYAHLNNKYIVTWEFASACKEGFLSTCKPTHILRALIDFRIRAEQILIDQI